MLVSEMIIRSLSLMVVIIVMYNKMLAFNLVGNFV